MASAEIQRDVLTGPDEAQNGDNTAGTEAVNGQNLPQEGVEADGTINGQTTHRAAARRIGEGTLEALQYRNVTF